jgi:hypothetical protein
MKSVVTIPLDINDYVKNDEATAVQAGDGKIDFTPHSTQRWVLWLWCNRRDAFIVEHEWKAEQIKFLLEGRISLLRAQQLLLDTVRLRFGCTLNAPNAASSYDSLNKAAGSSQNSNAPKQGGRGDGKRESGTDGTPC